MSLSGQTVLLRSAFVSSSGYGRDGISLALELLRLGVDLHIDPSAASVPLPPQVAALFTRQRPPRYDLVIQHADPASLHNPVALQKMADRSIGWTMWEYPGFKGELFERALKDRLAGYDEIFVYDKTSELAIGQYHPKVRVLQGGYGADEWQRKENDPPRNWSTDVTFRYAMVGQLHARKNPFAAIEAFNRLKKKHGEDFNAELHLKTNILGLHPSMEEAYPGLKIHLDGWSHEKMRSFYNSIHCLLAPSWGEGKNLPCLEAQTMGVPVMVSQCGGHMQWADPEWAYLLKGSIEEKDSVRTPGQTVVKVDVEDLAAQMWYVYTHRSEARRKGELASRTIPADLDWSSVVRRLEAML